LPQDVARFETYQIVAKIRCEMRDAIRGFAIKTIEVTNPDIAESLNNGSISFRNLDRKSLHPDVQRVIDKYDHTAIAYEFTFDITETNDASANFDLLGTFSRGPLKVGLKAGNERERQNKRNFRVVDTFEKLAVAVSDEYCTGLSAGKNWLYPITGSIRLDELVGAFLDLNQSGNLSGKEGKDLPTIADTIEFTTKLTGSASPSIELTPVGRGFELVKAGFGGDVSRTDVHTVVIVLSLPPEPKKLSRTGRTNAQQRAIDELNYQLLRDSVVEQRQLRKQLQKLTE
jgi:hypothetical protein